MVQIINIINTINIINIINTIDDKYNLNKSSNMNNNDFDSFKSTFADPGQIQRLARAVPSNSNT